MTTSTKPAIDEALIAEFQEWADSSESVPCAWEGCDTDIAWKLTTKCCGSSWFYCTPHRAECDRVLAAMVDPTCYVCEADVTANDWVWTPV